jgi:hypothetical protein
LILESAKNKKQVWQLMCNWILYTWDHIE